MAAAAAGGEPEVLTDVSIATLGQPERALDGSRDAPFEYPMPEPALRILNTTRVQWGLTGDLAKLILHKLYLKLVTREHEKLTAVGDYDHSPEKIRGLLVATFKRYHSHLNICLAKVLGLSLYTTADTDTFLADIFPDMRTQIQRYMYFFDSFFDQTQVRIFVAVLETNIAQFQAGTVSKTLALSFYDSRLNKVSRGEPITAADERQLSFSQGFQYCAIYESTLNPSDPLPDFFSEDQIKIHITVSPMPFTRQLLSRRGTELGLEPIEFSDLMHISERGFITEERTWYTIFGEPIVAHAEAYVAHAEGHLLAQQALEAAAAMMAAAFTPAAPVVAPQPRSAIGSNFVRRLTELAAAKKGGRRTRKRTRRYRKKTRKYFNRR